MYKVGSWLLLGLLRLLGLLPLRVHYALGRFVTWLLQYVVGYRRDEVMHNLTKAFPDEKVWDLRVVRKEFYRHLGEVIAETVWFGACRGPKRLHRQRLVEIDNPELVATYREASPGMVILAGHTGNWEIIGGIAAYNYSDIPSPLSEENYCVVYRALSSRVWGEIMRDNRTAPLHDRKAYEGYLESKDQARRREEGLRHPHRPAPLFPLARRHRGRLHGAAGEDDDGRRRACAQVQHGGPLPDRAARPARPLYAALYAHLRGRLEDERRRNHEKILCASGKRYPRTTRELSLVPQAICLI